MSKFFKNAASSSESSDSEESDHEKRPPVKPAALGHRFEYPSDNEDEGPKRVVRAQKDKVYAELKEKIHATKNAQKIRDFTKLLACLEDLAKSYEKAKTVMTREGLTTPRFFIRFLAELEDFVNQQWEEFGKNKKGLQVLRQKLRKYNKDFENELQAYRETPDPVGYSSGEADSDDSDEDDSEADQSEDAPKKADKKKKEADSDDEWATDSDAESSGSDIDIVDLNKLKMEELRIYFLKDEFKPPGYETKIKEKSKEGHKKDRSKAKNVPKTEKDDDDTAGFKIVTRKDDSSTPLFEEGAEITVNAVCAKLAEIIAPRGRKKADRKLFVRQLAELCSIAETNNLGAGILAKILFAYVTSLFEVNSKMTEAMEFSAWEKTLKALNGLLDLLAENSNVIFSVAFADEDENLSDASRPYNVRGSVVMQVKRLDDELTKIFQQCSNKFSNDYIERLKGEKKLCELIEKAQQYVDLHEERLDFDMDELATIYMLRIEHMYYKFSDDPDNDQLLNRLCKKIYSLEDAMLQRQRAVLCQIYHHSLHDRYSKAKELLLMSHIQAVIEHSEPSTQILYNRAICQLGLCAFRQGLIKEAHQELLEIHNNQRQKELLAQGLDSRKNDRTPEQEKRDRSLQVPYHMHINLEVMEYVFLLCSMLLEIPNIACYEFDVRRRLLSRPFHYILKLSERSPLIGPPESFREHVVAASRAMLKGDWRKCRDYIINEKMNAKIWKLFRESDRVKKMVSERIQKETLRTYLSTYSTVYTSVSFDILCDLFELDRQTIHSLVSRMIAKGDLSATVDEESNCISMNNVEPSRLEKLALTLTEKITQLVEINEQQIDPRGRMGAGNWAQRTGDDRARRGNNQNKRATGNARRQGQTGGQ